MLIEDCIRLSLLHHFGNDKVYNKYQCQMDSFSDDGILSLPMYSNVAKLLADDKDKIIIDIGCGDGCQQFLFEDFKGYIGIDKLQEPIPVCDNCKMYHGDCKDILSNLDLNDTIAISLHAGYYFSEIGDEVKKYFNRIIML